MHPSRALTISVPRQPSLTDRLPGLVSRSVEQHDVTLVREECMWLLRLVQLK